MRARLNDNLKQSAPKTQDPEAKPAKPAKITINDFIVKACAMALRDVRVVSGREA